MNTRFNSTTDTYTFKIDVNYLNCQFFIISDTYAPNTVIFYTQKIQNGIKRKAMDNLSERSSKLINHIFHDGYIEGIITQNIKNIR